MANPRQEDKSIQSIEDEARRTSAPDEPHRISCGRADDANKLRRGERLGEQPPDGRAVAQVGRGCRKAHDSKYGTDPACRLARLSGLADHGPRRAADLPAALCLFSDPATGDLAISPKRMTVLIHSSPSGLRRLLRQQKTQLVHSTTEPEHRTEHPARLFWLQYLPLASLVLWFWQVSLCIVADTAQSAPWPDREGCSEPSPAHQ